MKYTVPLCELYKVFASCNYNSSNKFCPVLLEIIDEQVKRYQDPTGDRAWLLQVWSDKGVMLYEKALCAPVCNWNIHGDTFVFQEAPTSHQITVVRFSEDAQAKVFTLDLPDRIMSNSDQINSHYNRGIKNFVIDKDKQTKAKDTERISKSKFEVDGETF